MYSLRLSASGGTALGFALGRFGSKGSGAAPAVHVGRRRSISETPHAAAPVPGDQGVGMDPAKQQQPPRHDNKPAGERDKGDKNARDDTHKTLGDVMSHSFGEGYSTRSDEEGFGGVYGGNDPVFNPGTEAHPSHPGSHFFFF